MTARPCIVGTAGHIDHGKTALVRRLTGIDTDRLPEEKARGISIDLGFAHGTIHGAEFAFVDVPGHERFVRNMVAGATGIQAALLVVAADDGVMPQTREHFDILRLLGIRAGLIAITKIDRVDREWRELVASEVRELVAGSFLETAPIVPVDSLTGAGFDTLQAALVELHHTVILPEAPLFRMPIDRVFHRPGHGIVVTGSIVSGSVAPGDALELLPERLSCRVRSVQSHGRTVEQARAGERAGVNLPGLRKDDLARGMELVTPGWLAPTHRLLVQLECLPTAPRPVVHRSTATLLIGAASVPCRIIRPDGPLAPGGAGPAELRTAAPVMAVHGQRFILRQRSPVATIGGGMVLDPAIPRGHRLRNLPETARKFCLETPRDRLLAWTADQPLIDWAATHIAPSDPRRPTATVGPDTNATAIREIVVRLGIGPDDATRLMQELETSKVLIRLPGSSRHLVLHARWDAFRSRAAAAILSELARQGPRQSATRLELLSACQPLGPRLLVEAAVDELIRTERLREFHGRFRWSEEASSLTKRQKSLFESARGRIEAAGLMPPTPRELAELLKATEDELIALLERCVERGWLIQVEELYFAPAALETARHTCEQLFLRQPTATVSQLREAWNVSRKYAFPLCGWFDENQRTLREGDVRRAGPMLAMPLFPDS